MRISDWSSDVCSSDLFAACERGLEQVRGVHRAFGLAGADQRVHLVDEQDDLALGRLHFVEHALQPLLELAAIFGARDQRAHVEREQTAVLQARSEERRVGKEWVSTGIARWWPDS